MAYLTLSQMSVGVIPVKNDCSLRRTLFKSINNYSVNLLEKSLGAPKWGLKKVLKKNNSNNNGAIVCVSTVEKVATITPTKVPVSPSTLETEDPPSELYTVDNPYTATVISNKRIVSPKVVAETRHIVLDHGGNVPHWEGQNYGVIYPGSGDANHVSYYSLASSRYGDEFNGKTASLCVLRSGQTGTYLCNVKAGDEVQLTGPTGKCLLLPKNSLLTNHIMVATSTGIAPFRGYLRRMFMELIPQYDFERFAWLIAGSLDVDNVLYEEEFNKYVEDYPLHFRYDKAVQNSNVQDTISQNGQAIFELLNDGANIYFSGHKNMMPPILTTFETIAGELGIDWTQYLSQLKTNGQWHQQVY